MITVIIIFFENKTCHQKEYFLIIFKDTKILYSILHHFSIQWVILIILWFWTTVENEPSKCTFLILHLLLLLFWSHLILRFRVLIIEVLSFNARGPAFTVFTDATRRPSNTTRPKDSGSEKWTQPANDRVFFWHMTTISPSAAAAFCYHVNSTV